MAIFFLFVSFQWFEPHISSSSFLPNFLMKNPLVHVLNIFQLVLFNPCVFKRFTYMLKILALLNI